MESQSQNEEDTDILKQKIAPLYTRCTPLRQKFKYFVDLFNIASPEQLAQALEDAETAIRLNPQGYRGYIRKANCLVRLKRESEAIEVYKQVRQCEEQNENSLKGNTLRHWKTQKMQR